MKKWNVMIFLMVLLSAIWTPSAVASTVDTEKCILYHFSKLESTLLQENFLKSAYHAKRLGACLLQVESVKQLRVEQIASLTSTIVELKQSLVAVQPNAVKPVMLSANIRLAYDALTDQNANRYHSLLHVLAKDVQANNSDVQYRWQVLRNAVLIREDETSFSMIESMFIAISRSDRNHEEIRSQLAKKLLALTPASEETFLHSIRNHPQSIPVILSLIVILLSVLSLKWWQMFHAQRLQ